MEPDTDAIRNIIRPRQRLILWMPTKHMGNLLVALKSIQALEQAYPDNPCYLVVDDNYRDLVAAAHLRSTPVYYPRKKIEVAGLLAKARLTLAFIRQLRACQGDIAIAIEGDKISQRFIPLSGCKTSLGPTSAYSRFFTHQLLLKHRKHHRFYDYACIAEQLTGQPVEPGYPLLTSSANNSKRIQTLIRLRTSNPDAPFAILHPGATKTYKQWPPAYFAQLAADLYGRGVNVVLTGAGKMDGETIEQVKRLCPYPVLSLHNQLNIDELIALCHQAVFFLGNDTGPTHLAAATGTPTYAIFGPTDENRWGPVGANVTILRSSMACEPQCSRGFCLADYRCMQTLTPSAAITGIQGYPTPIKLPVQDCSELSVEKQQPPTILHVFKRYSGNYSLLNAMVSTPPGKYRTLVCYLSGRDDGKNRLHDHGANAIYLDLPKKKINWHSPSTLKALARLIDREGIDLVVCQFRRTIPIGAIAARLSKKRPKVIGILHGIVGGRISLFEKLLNLAITPLIAGWVSVSKEGVRDMEEQNIAIPPDKIFYVQNGLDFSRFDTTTESIELQSFFPNTIGNERIYIVIGRLSAKKNQKRIITAFASLLEIHPESRLLIVGTGPDENMLKTITSDLKLNNAIVFTGFRLDVPALLKTADVFLMPSLREGLPLALLEAMASSKPVITSDINGIREVCQGVNCGWLINPEDEDQLFGALLDAARLSKSRLQEMGLAGKHHVMRNFTAEIMVKNYQHLYDSILGLPTASKNPLISVIIPAYNTSDFIEQTLVSACLQTYDNIEIIVVDDGSTDDTYRKTARQAAQDDRIRLLRHTKNEGISATRNTALAEAKGQYIAFLDADDLWDKTKIHRQVAYLEQHPQAGLVFTASRTIYANGSVINDNLSSGRKIPTGKISAKQLLIDRYPIITSSVMVRGECFDKVGLFNTSYTSVEDLDLWLRILQHYEQGYLPEVLTSYRLHNQSAVQNILRNRENKIRFLTDLATQQPVLVAGMGKKFQIHLHRQYLKLAKIYNHQGERESARMAYQNALSVKVPAMIKFKAMALKKRYLLP